jgi:hypothetical protein
MPDVAAQAILDDDHCVVLGRGVDLGDLRGADSFMIS